MKKQDAEQAYWTEALEETLDSMGLWRRMTMFLTKEQREEVGESLAVYHDCHSMAFYTPPASDRYNQIEREWKVKYEKLQQEFDDYVNVSEKAVKRILRVHHTDHVSIDRYGDVHVR